MRYTVSDFNGENFIPDSIENAVKKNISLFYDMHILRKQKDRSADPRTERVQKILLAHKTTAAIDSAVRNLVHRNETLDEFIERKEKEIK